MMNLNPIERQGPRGDGFTLIEAMVSLAVFSTLVLFVMSIAAEISTFSGNADANYSVQAESSRAFTRFSELMRKSGWNSASGVTYPRVTTGGTRLEFRILEDLDSNGYAFDAATGQIEWSTEVYTVRIEPSDDTLAVFDSSNNRVWTLGRYITAVTFQTVNEDTSLHLKEISTSITAQRDDPKGNAIVFANWGSVHMRN